MKILRSIVITGKGIDETNFYYNTICMDEKDGKHCILCFLVLKRGFVFYSRKEKIFRREVLLLGLYILCCFLSYGKK